jgi:Flp pilus assembly protein TadG
VLPLLLLFLFGIIDVGRLMWTFNQAEKATQIGVRAAVVTNVIPTNLDRDFAATYNLVGGDPVPTSTFSTTTCTSGSCTGGWGYNSDAFTYVSTRMQQIYPAITPANVVIRYDNVGLGFAGDPSGPDVSALVTVSLQNLTFQPIVLLGLNVTLPDFRASLTAEDFSGTVSN